MKVDTGLLQQLLFWVIGGGTGAITFFVMDKWVPASWSSEAKRYLSIALAASLAMAAFSASVALGYLPEPETAQGWVESLFSVGFVATGLSQVIHGRARLR